jgi:hypothetical protein
MAIRTLTIALAAAAMTVGASAQAAAPVTAPARSGASLDRAEQLSGAGDFLPFAVFLLAILAVVIFTADGDDSPSSP